jgi:predicted membrane protein
LTGLLFRAAAKGRVHGKGSGARGRLEPTLGSLVLASLLLCEVAAAMVGAQAIFFSTLVAAWLVLPAVVGPSNVLDAGCFYMLVSLGIVVVASVAN